MFAEKSKTAKYPPLTLEEFDLLMEDLTRWRAGDNTYGKFIVILNRWVASGRSDVWSEYSRSKELSRILSGMGHRISPHSIRRHVVQDRPSEDLRLSTAMAMLTGMRDELERNERASAYRLDRRAV
jgi:hypothetical protein